MSQSEQINELASALCKAQAEMEAAKKDSINPFFKSKYADLASVWDACRVPLTRNGLAITQTTLPTDGKCVSVVTTLMHASGQWISGTLTMVPTKPDPQGIGSSLSYARRYALSAIVGVCPEDDDAEASVERKPKQTSQSYEKIAPILDPGEYMIMGGDWAGTKIKHMDPVDLNEEVKKTLKAYEKMGKPFSAQAKKFIECADEFLNKNFPEIYESEISKHHLDNQ